MGQSWARIVLRIASEYDRYLLGSMCINIVQAAEMAPINFLDYIRRRNNARDEEEVVNICVVDITLLIILE